MTEILKKLAVFLLVMVLMYITFDNVKIPAIQFILITFGVYKMFEVGLTDTTRFKLS